MNVKVRPFRTIVDYGPLDPSLAAEGRALFGDQWDTPSIDAGIGVSKRVQLAITAPFSRVAYFDGSSIQGLGRHLRHPSEGAAPQ